MSRFHRFTAGNATVVVLSDGLTAFPGPFLMVGVDEAEQLQACRAHGLDHEAVESNMNCVLVRAGDRTMLFDTGAGSTMPGCGQLIASLDAAGIAPAAIDQVIHTHLHLDHVGSNVDVSGQPMFPNARYAVGQTEWDFWSSDETLAGLERAEYWNLPDFEPGMAATVRSNVLSIRDRFDVFPDDGEPAPGVRAIPAFGHTPGHLAFSIDLGTETLYITGDLVLSPFHIDHPDWYPAVDLDPVQATASRAKVFDEAAANDALVSGYHLPFPGIGRVNAADSGWRWVDEFGIEEVAR